MCLTLFSQKRFTFINAAIPLLLFVFFYLAAIDENIFHDTNSALYRQIKQLPPRLKKKNSKSTAKTTMPRMPPLSCVRHAPFLMMVAVQLTA